ncbi:MAG: S41 family peptidase [Bryobacteraceae bacterium]|nr:S41 family peptidase [Bryobacteraceae bacterium]
MWSRAIVLLALAASLHAQGAFANPDFEKGSPGAVPESWFVPPAFAAYQATWVGEGCKQGKGCSEIAPGPNAGATPGNLMQMFDAAPYRGKQIRYRAAVSVASGGRAGLWLRVDRPAGKMGFFDNMMSRPIMTQGEWQYFEINGFVHPDAEKIALGLLVYAGKARFDDASLTITGDLPDSRDEPARALTDTGLRNLTAFGRLYGIVRFFHPSDEAAAADWDRFAIEGVRKIEGASSPADLADALQSVFAPVAPTIRVFTGEDPKPHAALSPTGSVEAIRCHNRGFGQAQGQGGIYFSRRVTAPRETWKAADVLRLDLGQTVTALVPLALFKDKDGTLPHAAKSTEARPPLPPAAYSSNDRATRIADVVIAWNVFQHFYPYFDIAKTPWEPVLPAGLQEAARVKDGAEFHKTLLKMVAELRDGHGRVMFTDMKPQSHAPVMAAWIENRYVVTASVVEPIKPGDEIVAVNGNAAGALLEDMEKLISGATPQWKRARSTVEALQGPRGDKLSLTVRPYPGTSTKEVQVPCDSAGNLAMDARPKKAIVELENGIWYVDLTRVQDKEFDDALSDLVPAKGIVFDMRGYPRVSAAWFSHVTLTPLRSAQWHIPLVDRPGEMTFERGVEWNLEPKAPYLGAKKVFVTDGRAISYAESTMGIVENYKLGEILGEATAGTNGNVNPFMLPGGYNITWTGMKVLKHDGSQHHGVGIRPTIPVSRTQAGVAAGRDEILERGVAVLKQ